MRFASAWIFTTSIEIQYEFLIFLNDAVALDSIFKMVLSALAIVRVMMAKTLICTVRNPLAIPANISFSCPPLRARWSNLVSLHKTQSIWASSAQMKSVTSREVSFMTLCSNTWEKSILRTDWTPVFSRFSPWSHNPCFWVLWPSVSRLCEYVAKSETRRGLNKTCPSQHTFDVLLLPISPTFP